MTRAPYCSSGSFRLSGIEGIQTGSSQAREFIAFNHKLAIYPWYQRSRLKCIPASGPNNRNFGHREGNKDEDCRAEDRHNYFHQVCFWHGHGSHCGWSSSYRRRSSRSSVNRVVVVVVKMVVVVSMWMLLREWRKSLQWILWASRTWILVCKIMKDLYLSLIPFPYNDLIPIKQC